MSKISNDGLTRSGTGCFYSCTHMATVGNLQCTCLTVQVAERCNDHQRHCLSSVFVEGLCLYLETVFFVDVKFVVYCVASANQEEALPMWITRPKTRESNDSVRARL